MRSVLLRLAKRWQEFWFAVRMEQCNVEVEMDEDGCPVFGPRKSLVHAIWNVAVAWYRDRTCRHEWRDVSFGSREHGCVRLVCDKCGKEVLHWLY